PRRCGTRGAFTRDTWSGRRQPRHRDPRSARRAALAWRISRLWAWLAGMPGGEIRLRVRLGAVLGARRVWWRTLGDAPGGPGGSLGHAPGWERNAWSRDPLESSPRGCSGRPARLVANSRRRTRRAWRISGPCAWLGAECVEP